MRITHYISHNSFSLISYYRFASFLSKTQTFTVFRKPTKELKTTIRDTRKFINDEESFPKSMKNSTIRFILIIAILNLNLRVVLKDKLGLRNIVQGFLRMPLHH